MSEPARATEALGGLPSDPHDREVMLADVLEGLRMPQKETSSKYFYDQTGSELFERITRLPEYYQTRTERALLERWIPEWVESLRPAALVELGAGSAEKSRVVIDAMRGHRAGGLYVPVDVSGDFLHETARALRVEYDRLVVRPAVRDMTEPLDLDFDLPEPAWYALLGGTIGNFDGEQALRLMCRLSRRMRGCDRFLLGADLRPNRKKTLAALEAAYNDAEGVTAAFNLNVLSVLNRELGADFDLDAFEHDARYAQAEGRIEMHLRAASAQIVTFPGHERVRIAAGETIRTEISCKYDRPAIGALFAEAGLEVARWVQDDGDRFALVLGRPIGT